MPSILLITSPDAPDIEADLRALGCPVAGRADPGCLVREAARCGCDAVLAWDAYPAGALLPALDALQQHAPLPVLLFTSDSDAGTLAEALRCGVHAYVVNGYAPARLRALLQLARARFERETGQRSAHAELAHRFEERKLVDRAKGILMRAHQIPEDEAFRRLRQASMQEQQRVGLVSRRVIDAARDADAVNRAGQLRMLSQRLVKLYALQCAGTDVEASALRRAESTRQVLGTIEQLGRELSRPTFGDLLDALVSAWAALVPALQGAPQLDRIGVVDAGAERLLAAAEGLTAALEAASPLATLAIVNRAGRQRMLSQRLAKQALLASLDDSDAARAAAADAVHSIEAFETALRQLEGSPLSSPAIRSELATAATEWRSVLAGVRRAGSAEGRAAIAAGSETLLACFERLTALYAQSAQQLFDAG